MASSTLASSPVRLLLLSLATVCSACTPAPRPPSPNAPELTANTVDVLVPSPSKVPRSARQRTSWFSGSLRSRVLLEEPKGSEPRAAGEQELLISGAHLRVRETNEDGALVLDLTYDPDHGILYQLAPNFEVVAGNDVQPELSYTGNSRSILGRQCRELARREPDGTAHVWVTDELRVEPAAFRGFPIAGFSKQLEFTGGALELRGKVEHADRIVHLEVSSIEPGPLDDGVWQLDQARAKASVKP